MALETPLSGMERSLVRATLSWYVCGCGEQPPWEVTELGVSRLDVTLKVFSSKHPAAPVAVAAKLVGCNPFILLADSVG